MAKSNAKYRDMLLLTLFFLHQLLDNLNGAHIEAFMLSQI